MFRRVLAPSPATGWQALGPFSWRNKRKGIEGISAKPELAASECSFLWRPKEKNQKKGPRLWKKRLAPKFAKRVGGKQFLGLCIPRTCTSVPRFPPSVRANFGASSAFFPRPKKTPITSRGRASRAETRYVGFREEGTQNRRRMPDIPSNEKAVSRRPLSWAILTEYRTF